MDLKRKIKIIISIFVIILMILISIFSVSKYLTSKFYVKKLLKKGSYNVNFFEETENYKRYVKGNIEKIIYNNGDIYYYDYYNSESIIINNKDKKINIYTQINYENSPHASKYVNNFKEKEFKYKGKEKFNEIECIVIDLSGKKNNVGNLLLQRMWINKELGTIEKIAYYNKDGEKEKLISEQEYNMHTNEVTNDDIEKPDVNDYTEYEVIK